MARKNALLSVYNKTGIVEFARELSALDYTIIASGGTADTLKAANDLVKEQLKSFKDKKELTPEEQEQVTALRVQLIDLLPVQALTGMPPVLGHRVVTLHPKIHGGLLATADMEKELADVVMSRRIDLVCVDLYPLKDEIAKPGSTRESVIEQTDIGGPTLLRSAAKGNRIVIADSADRQMVLDWLKAGCPNEDEMLQRLRAKAEAVVADYALTSAIYHGDGQYAGFVGTRVAECAYGENAWQTPAALYSTGGDDPLAIDRFQLVAGSAPSYNNLCDLDRLLQTVTHIAAVLDLNAGQVPAIAVGVKHGNPCGAAVWDDPIWVIGEMIRGDLRAIMGGVVMVNFELTEFLADLLLRFDMPEGKRRLLDGIVAPAIEPGAVEMLRRKGDKCRILVNPALSRLSKASLDQRNRFRHVRGGFLVQPNYTFVPDLQDPELQRLGEFTSADEGDLLIAWAIGATSNSNTITLVQNGRLIGNGVGQQDRVGAAKLAVARAHDAGHLGGEKIDPFVAYSDSFFPFDDGPRVLAEAGVTAIFATSGSVKDEQVKEFCLASGVALLMLPDKKARGFFGH